MVPERQEHSTPTRGTADNEQPEDTGGALSGTDGAPRPSTLPVQKVHVRSVVDWAQRSGLFFALLLLGTYFTLFSAEFLTADNLVVILLQVAVVGIVAIPGAMLVLSGYVDLSVGSVAVLASIVFGELFAAGLGVGASLVMSVLVGMAWGLLNGVLIAYFDFSPIIVTLGGFAGARGVAEALSRGITESQFGSAFAFLGNGEVVGIPTPAFLMIVAFVVGGYLWYEAPTGRHMMAIGADKDAAHSNGVSVKRIPCILYVASGGAAALGGLILTSQLDGASLAIGDGLELQVLTAILLGGVSFAGGRGSLFGVLIGVLFVGVLNNGLVLLNVGPFYANVAIGAALVFAAGLDVLYGRLENIPIGVGNDDEEQRESGSASEPT